MSAQQMEHNSEGPTVTGQQLVRLNSRLCLYSHHASVVKSDSFILKMYTEAQRRLESKPTHLRETKGNSET